jgi:Trk K+ transport system NAD-binding subunit
LVDTIPSQSEPSVKIRLRGGNKAGSASGPIATRINPLADEFDLVQVGPPREFIGKNLKDLNLRAKYNVHIIAIKELVPENFILVPPASFVIKDSDILIMLGKTEDIRRIKAFK